MGGNLKIASVSAPPLGRASAGADSRTTITTILTTSALSSPTAAPAPADKPLSASASGSGSSIGSDGGGAGDGGAISGVVTAKKLLDLDAAAVAAVDAVDASAATATDAACVVDASDRDDDTEQDATAATATVTAVTTTAATATANSGETVQLNRQAFAVDMNLVAASDDSDAAAVTDETDSVSADEPTTANAASSVPAAADAQNTQDGQNTQTAQGAQHTAMVAEHSNAGVEQEAPATEVHRKRKRCKRLGFSGSRPKQKRQSACPPPLQVQVQIQTHTQLSETPARHERADMDVNADVETPESPILGKSAALYSSSATEATWDWSMSDVYYDPITQESLDQLVHVRKSCANMLAANVEACEHLQHEETAHVAMMLRDASDAVSARVCVQPRGRRYRDVWEEDDFLAAQRKRDALSLDKQSSATAFSEQETLQSYHDLVHGYDDDRFEQFMRQLEETAARGVEAERGDSGAGAGVRHSDVNRDGKGPSRPAAAASLSSASASASTASGVEDDEVAREISASLAKLLPLAVHNWRLAQTVYERAAMFAQCSSALQREAELTTRIEALYQRLYPPRERTDEADGAAQDARVPVFHSRRAHLIAHSVAFCHDSDEAQCVAASVEYALTLQVGDEVDVLDRNGCWSDGVVVDVFRERGQLLKFVLLRLSLWASSAAEWVSVTEGRVLPRGVAAGKTSFVVGTASARKRRIAFNRALADALEKSLPVRQVAQHAAARKRVAAAAAVGCSGGADRERQRQRQQQQQQQQVDDKQHRKRVKRSL